MKIGSQIYDLLAGVNSDNLIYVKKTWVLPFTYKAYSHIPWVSASCSFIRAYNKTQWDLKQKMNFLSVQVNQNVQLMKECFPPCRLQIPFWYNVDEWANFFFHRQATLELSKVDENNELVTIIF